jgi:hypothetical protein
MQRIFKRNDLLERRWKGIFHRSSFYLTCKHPRKNFPIKQRKSGRRALYDGRIYEERIEHPTGREDSHD